MGQGFDSWIWIIFHLYKVLSLCECYYDKAVPSIDQHLQLVWQDSFWREIAVKERDFRPITLVKDWSRLDKWVENTQQVD